MNNHHAVGHDGGIKDFATKLRLYTNNSGNGPQGNNIEGFASEIRRYTTDKVTILILSNRDTTNVQTSSDQIAQTIWGE
jgi:hypothetical protein